MPRAFCAFSPGSMPGVRAHACRLGCLPANAATAPGTCRAVKTMLGESCSSTEQAKGMAVLSLGWGMGSVLGPMLGGALTFPCDNYSGFPLCSPGALFSARCSPAPICPRQCPAGRLFQDATVPWMAGRGTCDMTGNRRRSGLEEGAWLGLVGS